MCLFIMPNILGLKCCVPNCGETRLNGTILHCFPKPEKEPDRFRTWLYAINGDILALDNNTIYKYRRVCHHHFETRYYTISSRLSPDAVPTLNLPGFRSREPLQQVDNINVELRKSEKAEEINLCKPSSMNSPERVSTPLLHDHAETDTVIATSKESPENVSTHTLLDGRAETDTVIATSTDSREPLQKYIKLVKLKLVKMGSTESAPLLKVINPKMGLNPTLIESPESVSTNLLDGTDTVIATSTDSNEPLEKYIKFRPKVKNLKIVTLGSTESAPLLKVNNQKMGLNNSSIGSIEITPLPKVDNQKMGLNTTSVGSTESAPLLKVNNQKMGLNTSSVGSIEITPLLKVNNQNAVLNSSSTGPFVVHKVYNKNNNLPSSRVANTKVMPKGPFAVHKVHKDNNNLKSYKVALAKVMPKGSPNRTHQPNILRATSLPKKNNHNVTDSIMATPAVNEDSEQNATKSNTLEMPKVVIGKILPLGSPNKTHQPNILRPTSLPEKNNHNVTDSIMATLAVNKDSEQNATKSNTLEMPKVVIGKILPLGNVEITQQEQLNQPQLLSKNLQTDMFCPYSKEFKVAVYKDASCSVDLPPLCRTSTVHTASTGINLMNCEAKKYRQKCVALARKVKKLQKANKRYKTKLKGIRKDIRNHPLFMRAEKKMSKQAFRFILMQLRVNGRKSNGRRFTEEEKHFALALFQMGRNFYRWFETIFDLPSISTLKKLLQNEQKSVQVEQMNAETTAAAVETMSQPLYTLQPENVYFVSEYELHHADDIVI